MRRLLTRILGDPNEKVLKKLMPLVDRINGLEDSFKKKTDAKLKEQTKIFKQQFSKGKTLDDILPEAFATVREVARRKLGQRHFDVQLIGGIVMHQGKIAEMKTGEGKTLVATLPVYLNALSGGGVHVVTVNDYLAQRDAGWMGQIYYSLGLKVGVIISGNQALVFDPEYINQEHDDERLRHLKPATKKEAYQADVTYGTNNEFGFDYLRDNMVSRLEDLSQRDLAYAIVDEVDSILIDEARTPLIISAPSSNSSSQYAHFANLARALKADKHYLVDEKERAVTLTEAGIKEVEQKLGLSNLYDNEHLQAVYHLEQALKAESLFKRDKDYVVRDSEVIIVDEFTGRLLTGRRYSEGLHQAIEAKEGVAVLQESMTLATISFQNYFRLYHKLAGMTGTAKTEEEEFQTVYGLDVVEIPPNKPSARDDLSDRIYKSEIAKFRAIINDVIERHQQGQPILLGTVSIEKNELLSDLLTKAKVKYEILNAKNNEREALIIANAGQKGAVTLATNIAGRGTDIVLGEGVTDLGGLHVIGTERHESRRIDNQLRGRSGRQGDPGSTQFYVSLEDDLMRIFGGERIAGIMNTLRIDEDIPIENRLISRALETAQKRVESHNFDVRKQVLQYDDVMNRHREAIYKKRRQILEQRDIKVDILASLKAEAGGLVKAHTNVKTDELEKKKLFEILVNLVPLETSLIKRLERLSSSELTEALDKEIEEQYKKREQQFTREVMRNIERAVYLQILDRYWMEHLESMQHLREGIGWQGLAGAEKPLTEYKRRGFEMFNALNNNIEREVAYTIFKVAPQPVQEVETELTKSAEQAEAVRESTTGGESKTVNQPIKRQNQKVGRNDPCPCGSGLKYKKCGLINSPEHRG